jgi:hypothetical protein
MDGALQPRYLDVAFVRGAGRVVQTLADAPFLVRIAALFVGVLAMATAFPARSAAHRLNADVIATPAPFIACGLDRVFDAGHCAPAKPAPLPCVQGAHGCMPTTATLPTPAPEQPAAPVVQQPADPFAGIIGITGNH